LSHGAAVGAAPTGATIDCGDCDRLAGGDLRRLFAVAPGDPARPDAATRYLPNLSASARSDLYLADQLASAGGGARLGPGLQEFKCPRLGLRLCGHRNNDPHHSAHRSRHAQCLGMAMADDRRFADTDHDRGPGIVRIEFTEDPDRRLVLIG